MKTSELTGAALDWAVAKCEGVAVVHFKTSDGLLNDICFESIAEGQKYHTSRYSPQRNWVQGGPIIEREQITVLWNGGQWVGSKFNVRVNGEYEYQNTGPTPLIAAMRCYVASKLGEQIEVPAELLK